jgi:hypothetical protein
MWERDMPDLNLEFDVPFRCGQQPRPPPPPRQQQQQQGWALWPPF